MISIRRTLILAIAALAAMPSHASAGPPGSTAHAAASAALRDGLGDVLLSDGNPVYADRDVQSTQITDYSDPASSDRFQFQPWRQRRVRIQSIHIDGGVPVTCDFSWILFTSSTTPNWYEAITSGAQPSVLSDAFFVCHAGSGGTDRRWKVSYPSGTSECAVIERLSATMWSFSVPGGCLATLTSSTKQHGKTTTTVQEGVSAPLQITAVIP